MISTQKGYAPTLIVAVTVLVAPLMTETVLLPEFATYTIFVEALAVMPRGADPTDIVEGTVLFAPLMTETLFEA